MPHHFDSVYPTYSSSSSKAGMQSKQAFGGSKASSKAGMQSKQAFGGSQASSKAGMQKNRVMQLVHHLQQVHMIMAMLLNQKYKVSKEILIQVQVQ